MFLTVPLSKSPVFGKKKTVLRPLQKYPTTIYEELVLAIEERIRAEVYFEQNSRISKRKKK